MTNHHVGLDALQKLSNKDKDYVKDGFYAKTLEEEFKCHDMELNVLMSIEDVTDRGQRRRQAGDERRRRPSTPAASVIAEIEKESFEKTKPAQRRRHALSRAASIISIASRSTPTSAWSSLPSSRSPSTAAIRTTSSIPRYDLDICFFRVYENDKPAKIEHYLKWSKDGGSQTTSWCSSPAIPAAPTGWTPSPSWSICATRGYPVPAAAAQSLGSAADGATAAAAKRTPGRPRRCSSACRTAARPASAAWPGCWTPTLMARKKDEEKKLQRSRRQGSEAEGRRRRPGTDRRGREGAGQERPALQRCSKAAPGFNTDSVRHRPHPGPGRRGTAQAERRAARASSATPAWNR